MTLFAILDSLLIGPLRLAFEVIFNIAIKFIVSPGYTIIAFSLIMNLLVLPLYRQADAMQELARDTEARLREGVAHIKKTFSGDERMMVLQTYYRQNNYKPTDALKGSVSLLLEIPFFMAAYQFLSHLSVLSGAPLGSIADLSRPDGLLAIGGLTLNLLPILMTLINVISSAIYLKGFPLKTKIQLYGMALFFLVFLYNSPSGLVFYWTLNNLFSLVKTIFYKLKNPRRILCLLASLSGLVLPPLSLRFLRIPTTKYVVVIFLLALVLQFPLLLSILQRKKPGLFRGPSAKPDPKLFFLATLFITVLTGLLIPSTYIAASPQEFLDIGYFYHPLWYVVSAACLAAGFFLVWMRVFYGLADDKGKVIFERLLWVLCGVMLVNYMFFGTDMGNISSRLQYDKVVVFSLNDQLKNLLVLGAVSAFMYIFVVKFRRTSAVILLSAAIALGGMSAWNAAKIGRSISQVSLDADPDLPTFQLSKTEKNVVILFLDRAMGAYVPYLLNEKPELEEKFDGFTYYANTISHGAFTNFTSPAVYGGYEYTPVELNKRKDESLCEKHNESLTVLPVLFNQNGFDVTVCDPAYADYLWIPSLSPYEDYPDIHGYISRGQFSDEAQKKMYVQTTNRNFFVFSIMKTMPLCIQRPIYNDAQYLRMHSTNDETGAYSIQVRKSISTAEGIYAFFMEAYNVIDNLSTMTKISEDGAGGFLTLYTDMTHEVTLLQTPDYVPSFYVDNREYDAAHADRFTIGDKSITIENSYQMAHYHVDMAAFLRLSEWFDYLRENDVYDNTRIILVSDHGIDIFSVPELMFGDNESNVYDRDVERFFPLLMVKDFDSHGFTTSYEFMTNADVATLAVEELIEEPINPFTGKEINSDEKHAHDQFVIMSWKHNIGDNNGFQFLPSQWASVREDLWKRENWTFYEGEHILTEHTAP